MHTDQLRQNDRISRALALLCPVHSTDMQKDSTASIWHAYTRREMSSVRARRVEHLHCAQAENRKRSGAPLNSQHVSSSNKSIPDAWLRLASLRTRRYVARAEELPVDWLRCRPCAAADKSASARWQRGGLDRSPDAAQQVLLGEPTHMYQMRALPKFGRSASSNRLCAALSAVFAERDHRMF